MIKLSIVAISATAMISSWLTADVDIKVSGQGVFYYQTDNSSESDFFTQENSTANAGLELKVKSDLGNGFDLEYQETFLGTAGLNKRFVSGTRQNAQKDDLNSHAMTRLYMSKEIENTLIKLGRQELPKSLSPLAFSEGWNVFKNSFDAIVAVNKDIIDTTIVGAYVSGSNNHNNLNQFDDLSANSLNLGVGEGRLNSGAYMLTVVNESAKNIPITASYYSLNDIAGLDSGNALWLDIKSNYTPVKLSLQAGQIDPSNNLDKTTAIGLKVSGKVENVGVSLAYASVNDGDVAMQNIGTGVKTPLYTQMIANQNFISRDADSFVFKAVGKLPLGKLIAQYNITTDNSDAKNDYNEFDLIYKFKAFDTQMFLAYIGQTTENKSFSDETEDSVNSIRFWSRYNF